MRLSLSLPTVFAIGLWTIDVAAQKGATYAQRNNLTFATHTFDQIIDHFPNSSRYVPHVNGTFKQRFWFDDSYYRPGGPVFVEIGGETDASKGSRQDYLKTGLIQILMEATNGLGVVLENRYYGASFPFNDSSTDNLRYLTAEQTIADNPYFAQHVQFPGVNQSINAPGTPWIFHGGSLAGQQTAFTLKTYGGTNGTIWGGIASSSVTRAEASYPQWYDPIQKYGPQDCIGSINAIVANVDEIFASNNSAAITQMKTLFGLETLTDADFGETIAYPLGGPLNYPGNTWQELNWIPTPVDDFWHFCANITNPSSPANITALDNALSRYTHNQTWPNLGNYAHYVRQYLTPLSCPPNVPISSPTCFGTRNATYWANPANDNGRSYLYQTCTENGLYQAAWTNGQPNLVSQIITPNYTQQTCTWAFPPGRHNSIPADGPDLDRINKYGGYTVVQDRLAFVDGDQDVWNGICYHSPAAPERRTLDVGDAYRHPQLLITGAGHHWDSYGIVDVAAEPQFIREAHRWEIRVVRKWLEEFEALKGGKSRRRYVGKKEL